MPAVLLVDESGAFRATAAGVLERAGCDVMTASGGTEALDVARRDRPQMIVVAADMTGMTGPDLVRVLKADPSFARVPIVLVGGGDGESGFSPADAALALPFNEEDFATLARRFLQLEPREEARSAVGWSITFWREGRPHVGTIRDLSRGGFFVRTPVRQPIGARVEVSFEVPSEAGVKNVVAEAMVVRIGREPDPGLGCRFFQLSAASRQSLEDCLRILSVGQR
jgi:CheY-like chemotaxis protein